MTTKSERIVRYTADEMKAMIARGESQTNWERVRALTSEEIEASLDVEDEGEFDHSKVFLGPIDFDRMANPTNWKTVVPVDADVADWFESRGPDFRARMNAVLRDYVDAQKRKAS